MKKVLLIGAVVVAAAVVAAPKLGSARFDQQLKLVVDKINQTPGYKATLISHQSGWFSADSSIELGLDLAQIARFNQSDLLAALPALSVTSHLHTQFGPLLFNDKAALGWYSTQLTIAGEQLRDKLTWDANRPLLSIEYAAAFGDAFYMQDSIAPFSFKDDLEEIQLSFSGYQGQGSWIGRDLSYQGLAEKMDISLPEDEIHIGNIGLATTADVNLAELMSRHGYDAKTSVSVDYIDTFQLQLEKFLLAFESQVNKSNDTSAVSMSLSLDKATYMASALSNLALNFSLENIDNAFVKDYVKFIEQLSGNTDPAQMQQQLAQFVMPKLPQLLGKSPRVQLSLSGNLPQGSLIANVDTSVVNTDSSLSPAQLIDEQFWLQHLKAQLHAKADEDVATLIAGLVLKQQLASSSQFAEMPAEQQQQLINGQSGLMLQQLLQQGMLTQEEGTFSISASLEDGIANLNGLPIPL
ncbi:DUF945 family protein [Shewanella avicenniae]|uniref:DUF945 family protein n=1 Tax=Shewanella avicenniae TaxID=2814294 RepID=A0ABX7QPI3_9GAMM|nr:DUF945 family protein [Shewanella avicenniae]QSX33309.1 DUF945 family protein [Shewanella avicenniae]